MNRHAMNIIETGGQFSKRRRYPGHVIADDGRGGWKVLRDHDPTPILWAPTLQAVADGMRAFRNPYTGERFTTDEAWPEGVPS